MNVVSNISSPKIRKLSRQFDLSRTSVNMDNLH